MVGEKTFLFVPMMILLSLFLVLMEYAIMLNEVGKIMKTCKYLDHWKNLHFLSLVHLALGM